MKTISSDSEWFWLFFAIQLCFPTLSPTTHTIFSISWNFLTFSRKLALGPGYKNSSPITPPSSSKPKFKNYIPLQKMAFFSSNYYSMLLSIVLFPCLLGLVKMAEAGNFYQDVDVTWGNGRGKIMENGKLLTLSLDKASGSGFQSKKQYLFGRFDMKIKLVPGNSAGTVTAYYVSPSILHKHLLYTNLLCMFWTKVIVLILF